MGKTQVEVSNHLCKGKEMTHALPCTKMRIFAPASTALPEIGSLFHHFCCLSSVEKNVLYPFPFFLPSFFLEDFPFFLSFFFFLSYKNQAFAANENHKL